MGDVAEGTATPETIEKLPKPEDTAKQAAEAEQASLDHTAELAKPKEEPSSEQQPALFDFQKFAQEYESPEGLRPETVEYVGKLLSNALGIPDEHAKGALYQFVDGVNARRTLMAEELFSEVGGREGYQKLTAWAADALPEAEIEAFNEAIKPGASLDQYKSALRSLKSKYEQAYGTQPEKRLQGGTPPTPSIQPLRSRAELNRLQADPRYAEDPAFRDAVFRRLKAGVEAGVYTP